MLSGDITNMAAAEGQRCNCDDVTEMILNPQMLTPRSGTHDRR